MRSPVELDSLEAIKQLVLLGDHISFMSRMAVQRERKGLLHVLPIPGHQASRHIYSVHNRDRLPSVQIQRFQEVLCEVGKQLSKSCN